MLHGGRYRRQTEQCHEGKDTSATAEIGYVGKYDESQYYVMWSSCLLTNLSENKEKVIMDRFVKLLKSVHDTLIAVEQSAGKEDAV